MVHLYSLITLAHINTCRLILNALTQKRSHDLWGCPVVECFPQLACERSVSRQRAEEPPEPGEGVGGVPPVSLCVLIEVFLPLNPAVFPPPCWLEENEEGGGLGMQV